MFYSQFILAKKGPLGTIWIAAHLERKLRKNQVADTDIGVSVDSILFPEVPIALRLSSHLLLGVVRIYSRKVNYLFDDCSEALVKVRQAFRSTAVDLPPEESKAPYHSITLPETFDLDDFELPDTDIFQGNFVDHHVSSKEQITLPDTMEGVVYSTSQFGLDERFGDGDTSQIGLDLDEELLLDKGASSGRGVLLSSCGDPQASVEPSSSLKVDERTEETDDASKAPANSTIQGPATPGLFEESNFPNSQQAQVSEDHMEEDHNLAEPETKELSDIAPSQVETATDVASVLLNGCFETSKDLELEVAQHSSVSKSKPQDTSAFQLQGESGETHTVAQNETLEPAESVPDKRDVNGFSMTLAESISEVDKPLDHTGVFACLEANRESEHSSMEQISIVQKNQALMPETTNLESIGEPLLQACNRHTYLANDKEEPGVFSAEMQEVNDLTMNDNQPPDTAFLEVASDDPNKLDGEANNRLSGDAQKVKEGSAIISDVSSPEKMLSLPHVPVGQDVTPEKEAPAEGDEDITMNKISGNKRSFTESTVTLRSMNSVEFSEATQSKRSVEFVPGDDDLLSSILVGRRSTTLKLKPTPPATELVSSKRPRVGSRSGAHKRKALVDDSMVLHGDKIREQLVNTEDIRRVRKKAPSTSPEIWLLQKQFLEDEIFSEPLLTGMSTELMWLHCHPFDLRGTKVVQDGGSKSHFTVAEGTESPSRTALSERTEIDGTSMPSLSGNAGDGQSLEDDRGNENMPISIQEEKTEMVIDKKALADVVADQSITSEVEIPTSLHHVFEDVASNLPNDTIGPSSPSKEIAPAGPLTAGTCENLDEQRNGKDAHCEDASAVVRNSGEGIDASTGDRDIEEHRAERHLRTEVDSAVAATSHLTDFALSVQDENNIEPTFDGCGRVDPTSDRGLTEGKNETEMENKDEVHSSDAIYNTKSPALDHLQEGSKPDSSIPTEGIWDMGNVLSVEGTHLEAGHQFLSDAAIATTSEHDLYEQLGDFEADVFQHDTGFLNYDDDEIAEADDNYMADAEGIQILDNSGWSTRTRAVANYLQTLFHKEPQHGRKAVHLDNLLVGKTRKEASRMFFETLVLETRGYIQAEQEQPFGNISIKPGTKLMKSEF